MKMQCERCKEIVPFDDFAVTDQGLVVRCGACAGQFTVPLPDPVATSAAPTPGAAAVTPATTPAEPGASCPKCAARVPPAAPACPTCGLLRARFAAFHDDELDAPSEVVAAWARLEAAWDDASRHQELADVVARHAAWPWALRAYRRSGRGDAAAAAARDRLVRMAEASLLAAPELRRRGGQRGEPYKKLVLLLFALLVAGSAIGFYVLSKAFRAAADPVERPTR
jgi:hypothetical protein